MRALKLFVLAFVVFTMAYCGKGVSVTFSVPSTTIKLSIDTTSVVGVHEDDTIVAVKDLDSIAKENKTSLSKLSEVKLKKVTINIASPVNGNFDALDSVLLVLSSPTLPGVEIKIADINSIPAGTSSYVVPNPSDENLLNLFKQKQVKLYGKLKTNAPIEIKHILSVVIETTAKVNPTKK